jgi:polyhydroxyalkanoate synthase
MAQPGDNSPHASAPGTGGPASAADPLKALVDLQQQALQQFTQMWSNALGALPGAAGAFGAGAAAGAPAPAPAAEDKRFAGQAWAGDPRFDWIRKAYLAYGELLQKSLDAAPLDGPARRQVGFAVRQFVDAMSPANFFASNPEAMQLAQETGGRSLMEGMNLFFQDLARGRVSMTDEGAFEVGRDLAVTPGDVVFENDLIQLIQYRPTTADVHARPLVIIPPCINKFYILDLQPENSFVAHAVAQGHTVFLASWRNITPELGHLTWNDYLRDGVLKAIDVAREISGADEVNTLGFCVGGTLLACALAVKATNDDLDVASATLLTTLLDFAETGELGTLVTEQSVAARELAIGRGGLLQGRELAQVFASLRANDLIWQYVVNSYLKGKAPPAFDLLYWNSDATNLPGPMFCWYIRNTYLENRLRDAGATIQCDVPVDLSEIPIPVFVYASREDHIVPWQSAFAARRLLGGDTTFVLGASGHIAGVINPPAKKKRNYWKHDDDGALDLDDPQAWLDSAQSVPGSWWPCWAEWLARHAGERVPAPSQPGSDRYRPIEPAPGRYVRAKAE